MQLIDTHTHLNDSQFDEDGDEVIHRARSEFHVSHMINVGYNRETIPPTLALAEAYDFIYAAIGWHPHDAQTMQDEDLVWIEQLAAHEKVVALGEMGLDYYRNHSPHDVQKDVFRRQIALAKKLHLPIIIHARESYRDVVAILKEEGAADVGGVMHCFGGDWKIARAALDLGFYIGLGGPLTFKKADDVRDIARQVPYDRLLVETDCPYLAPEPRRGRRNETGYVYYVAQKMAEVRGISLEQLALETTSNAKRLFKLP
ncbi:TatD family hydrolase [Numidum massiliense]|uniref:TatD family hydrolase n=1 Tax=Numidum massiliense TaxID=1522315 RepID=UPI0006D560E8|nr:TatD family hydrolase [Numidum massiliense]